METVEKQIEGFINSLSTSIAKAVIERLEPKINEITKDKYSELITRKQASSILGVTPVTIMAWEKKGIITNYRINSRVRYKLDEVYLVANNKGKLLEQ